jgi:peptidoglycan/xylan/chitin deacetylase (PgdA/CDA1 family)
MFMLTTALRADISFSGVDLNPSDGLLFTVTTDVPGAPVYDTLFSAVVENYSTINQLTFFPERISVLDEGKTVRLENRYGTALYSVKDKTLSWQTPFKGFNDGAPLLRGRMEPVSVSPDGKWMLYVRKTDAAYGDLILYDVQKKQETVVAFSVERNLETVPVSWIPDSTIFIYAYRGSIYFARPDTFFTFSRVDEQYRKIGLGTTANIFWISSARLIYIQKNEVYAVSAMELLTRSLYSPVIGSGELIGKLPFSFDPGRDSFAAGNGGATLLVSRGNRMVFCIEMKGDDFGEAEKTAATLPVLPTLPYLPLQGSTVSTEMIWPENQEPVIRSRYIENGAIRTRAWRMSSADSGSVFTELSLPSGSGGMSLSPGKNLIAIHDGTALHVYDFKTWKPVASYTDEPVVSFAWADRNSLYTGSDQTIRKWTPSSNTSSVLYLSGCIQYGWNEQNTAVIAKTRSAGYFTYNRERNGWDSIPETYIRGPMTMNSNWRVYLDASENGYFDNAIYLRSSAPYGRTAALLKEPLFADYTKDDCEPEPPSQKDPLSSGVFSSGPRYGKRRMALTFDALDNADGLPLILDVLSKYRITATFFINGEFIRRHPEAVKEIVEAGHHTCSLFFSPYDLTDPQFRIDMEFLLKGLARNEDSFYEITGRELSLYWHTPYYMVNTIILEAGTQAGYTYVGADIYPADWATLEMAIRMPGIYKTAGELMEYILTAVKAGSVVPVGVGRPEGIRSDYLYEVLDILVDELVSAGYEIVPVSVLAPYARRNAAGTK